MRNSERGFTLFEVLGAVALLAIVYSTLATVAIRGVRSEGESRRSLEASLRADAELAEFELQIDQGEVPELGTRSSDEGEDGLTVTWEVMPFTPQFGGSAPVDPYALQLAADAPDGGLAEMFATAENQPPPFLEIVLTVSWREGALVRAVTRTTFMVDETVATAKIEAQAERIDEASEPLDAGSQPQGAGSPPQDARPQR